MTRHRLTPFGVITAVIFWAVVYVGLLLVFAAVWVRWAFGPIGLDEMIANLPTTHGGGVGDSSLVVSIAVCLIAPLVVVGVGVAVVRRTGRPRKAGVRWLGGVAAVLVGALVFAFTVGVPQYASAALADRSIEPYYVAPSVSVQRHAPRNLITIYLESGESAYRDARLFGSNLLAPLDAATADWHDYALDQYHGGGWTMAGMVSTQCGIPLKHVLVDGLPPAGTSGGYLPGATCLGDVLAAQGYTSAFLGGADSGFAGKGAYFTDHGYTIDKGLADWKATGEGAPYISAWGLADSHLMRQAERVVTQLRAAGKPFNLTMLTLDTHEPPGLFPDCTLPGSESMATAVTCSARAVASFIDYLRQQHVLDDTVVMVMGDHLKMLAPRGAFATQLGSVPQRQVVMKVWSPDPVRFTRQGADQLSVFPTTVELLGLALPQGRAGVGVSFIGGHDTTGSLLDLPQSEYEALLDGPSTRLYRALWKSP